MAPAAVGEDRGEELLVAWPRLAAATLRVVDAVALDPAWLDDTGSVRDVLAALARRPGNETPVAARRAPDADRDVIGIAVRLGLIADLLATRTDEAVVSGG